MEASSQRSGLLDFWRYVSGMDQASPPFRVTITRMHGGLPEGATAHVVPLGIRVTSDSGFAYDMPFAAMKLDATGLESEFVSCRDATLVISSDIPAFHDALRAHGGDVLAPELDALTKVKKAHRSRGRLGIALAVGLVATVATCFFATPRLVAAMVMWLPTSVDRTLGDAADGEVASFGPRSNDPDANAFVQTIVRRLAVHAGEPRFDYRVTVVQSEEINAFALPGGRIVVLSGVLGFIERPDELAAVLGHEIAHVTGRHGMRNVAHRLGTGLLLSLLFGDASDIVQAGGATAAMAMDNGYSRDQESAADIEGLRIADAAGFDGVALAAFFTRMEARASSLEQAMTWLGDHPDNAARIATIRQHAPTRAARAPDALDAQLGAIRAKLAPARTE